MIIKINHLAGQSFSVVKEKLYYEYLAAQLSLDIQVNELIIQNISITLIANMKNYKRMTLIS